MLGSFFWRLALRPPLNWGMTMEPYAAPCRGPFPMFMSFQLITFTPPSAEPLDPVQSSSTASRWKVARESTLPVERYAAFLNISCRGHEYSFAPETLLRPLESIFRLVQQM